MKCSQCGHEFGDLQAEKKEEYYNSLDDSMLVRIFKCPQCGAEVEDSLVME